MDQLVRAMTKDGAVKAVAVTTKEITERARNIQRSLPAATAAIGRALAAASMMGNALKEEDASLTLQIKGGGPLGTVLAVSDHLGGVLLLQGVAHHGRLPACGPMGIVGCLLPGRGSRGSIFLRYGGSDLRRLWRRTGAVSR